MTRSNSAKNVALILLLSILVACSSNKSQIVRSVKGEFCLVDSEFSIAGIKRYDSKSHIKYLLKTPLKISKDSLLNIEIWQYNNLMLEFYNNKVWSITTRNTKHSTPSGIHPGMTKNQVAKAFGKNSNIEIISSKDGSEIQIVNCRYEVYMIFTFNNKDTLKEISINLDFP